MKKTLLLAGAALALTACTPTQTVRGNLLQDYQLAEIVPGTDTQSDILRKLGSPTTKAPFDDSIWYYLGQETEKRGILDPEIKKERIVAVTFADSGVVEKVEDLDTQRNRLPYVREKTPTSGHDYTMLQQLLGNVGRFNTDAGSATGDR